MRSHLLHVLAAAALLITPAACLSTKTVCAPRSTQACSCHGIDDGARTCAADGARWEPCACAPPPSVAPTPDGSEPTSRQMPPLSVEPRLRKAAAVAAQVKLTVPELQSLGAPGARKPPLRC
jgi:hypothetical protein